MRLIDADKLMEDMQKTITEQSGTIDWLNLIHRQHTAYDIEKIIEKLEELNIENQSCSKCAYREECDTMQEKNDIEYNVCLCTMLMKLKAIDIVKQEAEKHTSIVHSEEYEKGFEDGAESVRSIAQYQDIGWIPCSVAMPEGHKQYDITTKNDAGIHSDTAIFNPFVGMWFWDEAENNPIEIEVLAWAEKREPYQPKGE